MEKGEHFCTVGGNADGAASVENNMEIPQKIKKMDLPFDPVVPLLGIYPKKTKPLIQKNISIPMSITTLFTIAKIWKQPK